MRKGDGDPTKKERALYYFGELIDNSFFTPLEQKIRQNATFLVVTKKEQIPSGRKRKNLRRCSGVNSGDAPLRLISPSALEKAANHLRQKKRRL
jgi:hypothetical protein